jgi:hypothetical protein
MKGRRQQKVDMGNVNNVTANIPVSFFSRARMERTTERRKVGTTIMIIVKYPPSNSSHRGRKKPSLVRPQQD